MASLYLEKLGKSAIEANALKVIVSLVRLSVKLLGLFLWLRNRRSMNFYKTKGIFCRKMLLEWKEERLSSLRR